MDVPCRAQPDPGANCCRRFRIGDIAVELSCDCRGVMKEMAAFYPDQPCLPSCSECVRLSVKRRRRLGPARYDILSDGATLSRGHRQDELFGHLEWAINHQVIAICRRYLQIHAASLAYRGRGVILAGPSGAGKSTLAAGLLVRGWQYMCDEFALIEPRTLTLRPFPKALSLKPGSFLVADRLHLELSRSRGGPQKRNRAMGYLNPRSLPHAVAAEPAPVEIVLFPKYTGQAQPNMRPLSRGRAAFNLAAYVLNRDAFADRGLSITRRIARRAACLVVETGTLEETCELIESAAARPAALQITE